MFLASTNPVGLMPFCRYIVTWLIVVNHFYLSTTQQTDVPTEKSNVKINKFIMHTDIIHRYAMTKISSQMENKANKSEIVQFAAVVPETAFVTGFSYEMNNTGVVHASINSPSTIDNFKVDLELIEFNEIPEYTQRVKTSNLFICSMNLTAKSFVTFNLTYEELLTRRLGVYKHVLSVHPRQTVDNLQVTVNVADSFNITDLQVEQNSIATDESIPTTNERNSLRIIRQSSNTSTMTWTPSIEEQLKHSARGVSCQIFISYDVHRSPELDKNMIWGGDYVVLFDASPMPIKRIKTHSIFVLDLSGSMRGRKIEQVKKATNRIITEINPEDYFSLIIYWKYAQVLTISNNETGLTTHATDKDCIIAANKQNKKLVNDLIDSLQPLYFSNIGAAITKAFKVAELGQNYFQKIYTNVVATIIMLISDGGSEYNNAPTQFDLLESLYIANTIKVPIYILGYGEDADTNFLKSLSHNNSGFARTIYDDNKASFYIQQFYKEISSPVMCGVEYKFNSMNKFDLTKNTFHYLFNGSEIMVAGKFSSVQPYKLQYTYRRNYTTTIDHTNYSVGENNTHNERIEIEKIWVYLKISQLLDTYDIKFKDYKSVTKKLYTEIQIQGLSTKIWPHRYIEETINCTTPKIITPKSPQLTDAASSSLIANYTSSSYQLTVSPLNKCIYIFFIIFSGLYY